MARNRKGMSSKPSGSVLTVKPFVARSMPTLAPVEAEAINAFAAAEKAEATRRGYRSDFAGFARWCETRGVEPLPASPDTLAAFLADRATAAGDKPSTLSRKMAAIRYAHRLRGAPSPTDDERVSAVMRGIRRTKGAAPNRKAAATVERIKAMIATIPADTLRGKRDRALLAFGMAGAFRRSELVALRVEDIERVPDGMLVTIRKSKTDQESAGQVIAILRGSSLRPVHALLDWLAAAEITSGPVFRSINRHGRVGESMTPQTVAVVVKEHADAAGYDPAEFAGHSLRAGFLTSAAETGADAFHMMDVSRHRRLETLSVYVRRANLFKNHAGSGFL